MALTASRDNDVYELPAMPGSAEIPAHWQASAIYRLEAPVGCPHCGEQVSTLRVIGLSPSQVSAAPAPRKGRVIVCPECDRIVSAAFADC
jgi:hypothetical protein